MKAIINDKLYDTEKSQLIIDGKYQSGLYQTSKGGWFWVFDPLLSAPKIEVISEEQAKVDIGKYAPDRYADFFGLAEEG